MIAFAAGRGHRHASRQPVPDRGVIARRSRDDVASVPMLASLMPGSGRSVHRSRVGQHPYQLRPWRDVQASGAGHLQAAARFDGRYAHAAIGVLMRLHPGSHDHLRSMEPGGWRIRNPRNRPADGEAVIHRPSSGAVRASATGALLHHGRAAGSRPTPDRRPPPRRATTCPQTDSCARTRRQRTGNTWWSGRSGRERSRWRSQVSIGGFVCWTARPRILNC